MKQSVIVILVCFICSSSVVYSQPRTERSILTGKITDMKTGDPIPGATIFIHDTRTGAAAGADGSFKTSFIPAGRYLVEISSIGYKTVIESVDVKGTTEKNFIMTA